MSGYRDPETGARPTPEPELSLFTQDSCGTTDKPRGVHQSETYDARLASTMPQEQAHARRSDPIHSHEASRSVVNLGRTRDGIIDILKLKGPLTDEQIWAAYSAWYDRGRTVPRSSPSGLRSRRAELVRMGFVCEGGTGKTASGRACSIWKLSGEYAAGVSQ